MTIYDNLEVMLRDMVGFMRAAPDVEILAADDPRQGLWGYVADIDPVVTWEIPVAVLAQENPPAYVRSAVRSREGRTGLVDQGLLQVGQDGLLRAVVLTSEAAPV